MRAILLLFLFALSYANFLHSPNYHVNAVNADKDGYIDNITVNQREFDTLNNKEIVFYLDDLEDGKVVIRGILESNSKDISVHDLHVEVSIDGGKSWHIAQGNSEWQWGFKPIIGKTYKLSLRIVKFSKQITPKPGIQKPVYITKVKPNRIIKNQTTSISIKGENFTTDTLFMLESKKAKIISVNLIDTKTVQAKVVSPKDMDMDVSKILFKTKRDANFQKSKVHLWFVNKPKIPKNFKLQCEDEKEQNRQISDIVIEPKAISDEHSAVIDTGTSQGAQTNQTIGYIPFLDDQTKLKWSVKYNVKPFIYYVTFYTVDKKKIKSIPVMSNGLSRGTLKLTPNELYEIYKKVPKEFKPESNPQNNPDKYKLSYYVKNFPGARFLFWKVEAYESIFECKGLKQVKTAESEFSALRMGKAPTGTVCDSRNKLLTVTKTKGSKSEVFYPGDTIELYGHFSLENSPWSPKDIVIDWGDGLFDIVDLHEYDRDSALSCKNLDYPSLDCVVQGGGESQMIDLKKEHIYTEAGRFKIRVYVLPVDELGNASNIAKRNKEEAKKTAFAKKDKFYYYAMANSTKSDINQPYKISSFKERKKFQSSSDRIFEIYCNPLNIYIVKDPDANGPLKLTLLKITGYSSQEKNKVSKIQKISTISNLTAKSSTINEAREIENQLGAKNPKKPVHATVTTCNKILFAKAKLLYHGHGFVKISWLVDGVKTEEKEYELGPTKNRNDLNYADPSSWQKPIDETLEFISAKLPVQTTKHHEVKVIAKVISSKTQNILDNSIANILSTFHSHKNKSQKLSSIASYDVKMSNPNKLCLFLYPVENGKYLQIFDIENLHKNSNGYSGDAKVLFHLVNSPNGVGEYYMPLHFKNWKVNKEKKITQGELYASFPVAVTTDAGVKLQVKSLKASIGKKLQITSDISLSNNSLFLEKTNTPIKWKNIKTSLGFNGDMYVKNKTLPLTRIGWSLFNISSKHLSIDLSHKEGKGGCGANMSRKWVGVSLDKAKLYPYTFYLANELYLPVHNWVINGSGLCGQVQSSNNFSHLLGEGKIGWNSLKVNAKNNKLSAKYKGFYVDIPWPKVRLSGGDISLNYTLSDKNDVGVEVKLTTDKKPKEKYGSIEMEVKKIKGFTKINKEWGIFADIKLIFYDRERKQKITANIKDMFFTMFTTAGFGKNFASSLKIPLKNQTVNLGGSILNVANVTLKTYQKHGSIKKLESDMSAFLTLEKWSQSQTHITYSLKKESSLHSDELHIAKFTPVSKSYPLNKPMNKSTLTNLNYIAKPKNSIHYAYFSNPYTSKSDISFYPHLAGLNTNVSNDDCSASSTDTFSAHVNTSFFPGAPSVDATFRYGTLDGRNYWLIFCELNNARIPVFPSVFLNMIRGGVCYGFDPDDLVHGSGCNATPHTEYGLSLALGADVIVIDEGVVKVQSTLIINPHEKKVGFYGLKGSLIKQVDIEQGKMEYVYKSHFQTTIGAKVELPKSNPVLKVDATGGKNGKIDLYMGSVYYMHVGTEQNPITAKLLIFRGDGYLMIGTDTKGLQAGFHTYIGFSSEGENSCTKSRADCASIGVDTTTKFGLYYDPFSFFLHSKEHFDATACISFGKTLGTACAGVGATGDFYMGYNPTKLYASVEVDFPSPVPNVGIGIGIIPADFDIDIHW